MPEIPQPSIIRVHPWNPWFHLRDDPSFTRGRWNNFGPQAVTNWSAGDLARENTAAGSLPLQGIVAWATVPRSPRVTTARNGVHALPVFRHPWKPSIIPKHPGHGGRSRASKGRVRCPNGPFTRAIDRPSPRLRPDMRQSPLALVSRNAWRGGETIQLNQRPVG